VSLFQSFWRIFGRAAPAPDAAVEAAAAAAAGQPVEMPEPVAHPAPLHVELQSGVRSRWTPPAREIARWATAALGDAGRGHEISVRIVGPAESKALNARFRGRNKPTNVLSFPAAGLPGEAAAEQPEGAPLGDLVICAAVVESEARAQGKPLRAHWAHLVVHGALHLVGYDHEQARDALRMERLEIRVLRRLGFPDPYRSG
jgi:probable rRNA maturation factor